MEENISLEKKYRIFREENPLGLLKEELEKVEADILNPRAGVVSDEYVDFTLWAKGLKSRQEYFTEYVEKIFPLSSHKKLLEVGCGRAASLSALLAKKGYNMTAMDSKVMPELVSSQNISCIRSAFIYKKTDITEFDAVIAQEPCEATEHIIRECARQKKDYIISLCGTAHRLMNGELPEDVYAWYKYLEEIGGENCLIINTKMIPGYVSNIMLCKYRACGNGS